MLKEITQNRKQGSRIEALIKHNDLSIEVIAKKLGTKPNNIAKIIWGERKHSLTQEGIAMMLKFEDWKALSAFVENDREWEL